MRVLVLAPWFRTLGHLHARGLQDRGHDVLLVSTNGHFEPGYGLVPELIVDASLRSPWPRQHLRVRSMVERFNAEVVLLDETWDLRFLALAGSAPTVVMVHDVQPHDARHVGRPWQRHARALVRRRATALGCFSRAAARDLAIRADQQLHLIPLTSEMPDSWVSPSSSSRRDFLVLGRVSPYKNLPVVFEAWRRHVASPAYRGDRLVIRGSGALDEPLPPAATWEPTAFTFREQALDLTRFKASVVMYRAASQSGVQVLSMQCGTVPIASDAGGLPEYQPPVRSCLRSTDVEGLTTTFGELSDPTVAASEGALARVAYLRSFSQTQVGARLEEMCLRVRGVS